MADSNWIKLNRGIWDNFIWDFDKPKFALAWIDMLLMANYMDKKIMFDGKVETIPRGSFITSMVKLSGRWKMDRGTVKRFLDLLQNDGMITYTCNSRRTAITIVNYSVFQSFVDEYTAGYTTAHATTEPTADTTTHTAQHKKVKKVKENKEIKNVYGEYQHVSLSDSEYEKLASEYGAVLRDKAIKFLDEYIEETPSYKKKSHYLSIRRWVIGAVKEKESKQVPQGRQNKFNNCQQRQYDMDAMERMLLNQQNPPKTVEDDPELKAQAEALKRELQEKYG